MGMVCHAAAPRCIGVSAAADIAATLPPTVTPVLLFVDAPQQEVAAACAAVPNAWLQFHGAEAPQYCANFARPYLKACMVDSPDAVANAMRNYADARAIVADGGAGTGQAFPWELVPDAAERLRPLFLAGGLNQDNVAAAIAAVGPEFVDVSSGVCRNGDLLRKDLAKIRAFINEVQHADG